MQAHIAVENYMRRTPPTVQCGALVSEVIELLLKHSIAGTPVVNDINEVLGFVSEHDCISRLLQSSYYCEPEPSVDEVMTQNIEQVSPNDNIVDLAQKMLNSRRHVFPVIENNKLIGIINRTMVLSALKDNQKECSKLSNQSN